MAKEKPTKVEGSKPREEKPKKGKAAQEEVSQEKEQIVPARLKDVFNGTIVPALMKRFAYSSIMQVPRLEKISINVGIGKAMQQDPKTLETVTKELEQIVGQKVVVTKSKKSISNFKLREGMPVGVRVTLRGSRMYEFLDRFINVAVPRIRDFRGLSDKSFDGRGNYTIAIKEHVVFPEIDVDKITKMFGMDITIVTTAKNDGESYELLKGFGLPFVKRESVLITAKAA
ncbi:MAG: 50S ribosomal protein L5 [Ignavibacteriales bacterium]|nr:50S ribosomal protein L5 [Ignavibacteriales bacterium]